MFPVNIISLITWSYFYNLVGHDEIGQVPPPTSHLLVRGVIYWPDLLEGGDIGIPYTVGCLTISQWKR